MRAEHFIIMPIFHTRPSSVSIATRHGLGGPRIESRWERDFPYPSRLGTRSLPAGKRQWYVTDYPQPSRVELYLYDPSGPSWPVLGKLFLLPHSSTFQAYNLPVWCFSTVGLSLTTLLWLEQMPSILWNLPVSWILTLCWLDGLLIKYPQFLDVSNALNFQPHNKFLLTVWHCRLSSWAWDVRNCI
jgi:hypothetical protein